MAQEVLRQFLMFKGSREQKRYFVQKFMMKSSKCEHSKKFINVSFQFLSNGFEQSSQHEGRMNFKHLKLFNKPTCITEGA